LNLPADTPLILFVGNLVSVKGLDVLLDACGRLHAGGVSYTCLLIGAGPLRGELDSRVQHLGLRERIRFVGQVPNDQLPDWYRAATVFVLPSRSEGVPNVLLEAAACGAPFVASRVGGVPEVTHLGINQLVPPNDSQLLADALAAFLERDPSQAETGASMRNWDQAAGELIDFFQEVLASRRHQEPASRLAVDSPVGAGSAGRD
jgi:glycosyltransferase involved in cell wall biosynthesis